MHANTAPTNAQVDILLAQVHEESCADPGFRAEVIGDHQAHWLRLRSQRATIPPGLQSHDHKEVQENLGDIPGCRPTLHVLLTVAVWYLPRLG